MWKRFIIGSALVFLFTGCSNAGTSVEENADKVVDNVDENLNHDFDELDTETEDSLKNDDKDLDDIETDSGIISDVI